MLSSSAIYTICIWAGFHSTRCGKCVWCCLMLRNVWLVSNVSVVKSSAVLSLVIFTKRADFYLERERGNIAFWMLSRFRDNGIDVQTMCFPLLASAHCCIHPHVHSSTLSLYLSLSFIPLFVLFNGAHVRLQTYHHHYGIHSTFDPQKWQYDLRCYRLLVYLCLILRLKVQCLTYSGI